MVTFNNYPGWIRKRECFWGKGGGCQWACCNLSVCNSKSGWIPCSTLPPEPPLNRLIYWVAKEWLLVQGRYLYIRPPTRPSLSLCLYVCLKANSGWAREFVCDVCCVWPDVVRKYNKRYFIVFFEVVLDELQKLALVRIAEKCRERLNRGRWM